MSAHLLFDRPILGYEVAALLGSPAHWVFDRGALTGRLPERGQYLTVVSSGAPELLEIRGRELVDLLAGELTGRLGAAELLWSRVSREPAATFAARPGTAARRPGAETDRPGVVRAGAWTETGWPATMEGAVRSGRAAARVLLDMRPTWSASVRHLIYGAPLPPPAFERNEEKRARGARSRDKSGDDVSATRWQRRDAARPVASELERTLGRAVRRLLSLQRPDGWWVGELESNVTMTAQHLLLLEFLRLRDEETTRRCANELLARQRPDGLWAIYWGGEPDLAATLESYAALRLAGLSADDERLAAGAPLLRGARRHRRRACLHPHLARPLRALALGGDSAASAGADPAEALAPVLGLRLCVLGPPDRRAAHGRHALPPRAQAAAGARLPRAEPRAGVAQADRRAPQRPGTGVVRGPILPAGPRTRARLRGALDRRPPGARRLVGRHPAPVGVVADRARLPRPRARVPAPPPRARRAGSGSWSRTATACAPKRASRRSGTPVSRSSRCGRPASPQTSRRSGGPRSGWSPRRSASGATGRFAAPGSSRAAGRSSTTTTSTRTSTTRPSWRWPSTSSAAGAARSTGRAAGWPACRARTAAGAPSTPTTTRSGSTRSRSATSGPSPTRPPPTSPPTSSSSWRARAATRTPCGAASTTCSPSRRRTARGSAAGASTTSTAWARCCPRSRPPGFPPDHPAIRRAVAWLEAHQNEDGGFGEDCRSYDRGEAGARLARTRRVDALADSLGAARPRRGRRGGLRVRLAAPSPGSAGTQKRNGGWDEPHFTGTGFPRDFLINYHLYREVWPVLALGRVRAALAR